MRQTIDKRLPRYNDLIEPTFIVLQNLGGSGNNEDILSGIISYLNLESDIVDIPHKDSSSLTELSYQAAWARTYMRLYGVIQNVPVVSGLLRLNTPKWKVSTRKKLYPVFIKIKKPKKKILF